MADQPRDACHRNTWQTGPLSEIDFSSRPEWSSPFRRNHIFVDRQSDYKLTMIQNLTKTRRNTAFQILIRHMTCVRGELRLRDCVKNITAGVMDSRRAKVDRRRWRAAQATTRFASSQVSRVQDQVRAALIAIRRCRVYGLKLCGVWVEWTKRALNPRELKLLKHERLEKMVTNYRISQAFDDLAGNFDELMDIYGKPMKRQELLLQTACCRHIQAAWRGYRARQLLEHCREGVASRGLLGYKGWRIRPTRLSIRGSAGHPINTASWTAVGAPLMGPPPPNGPPTVGRRGASLLIHSPRQAAPPVARMVKQPPVARMVKQKNARCLRPRRVHTRLSANIYQPAPFTCRNPVRPVRASRVQARPVRTAPVRITQPFLPRMCREQSYETDEQQFAARNDSYRLMSNNFPPRPVTSNTSCSMQYMNRPATHR